MRQRPQWKVALLMATILLIPLASSSQASDANLNDFKYFIGGGGTNFVNWNNQAPGLGNFYIPDIATQSQGDAYDNGGIVGICTTDTSGCTDGTFTSYTGTGTADLPNNQYVGSTQTINGLDVISAFKFSTTYAAARVLVTLTNNAATVKNKSIQLSTDLGCDSACYVRYDSVNGATPGTYGNTPASIYQSNASWLIITDAGVADPPISFIFGASGSSVTPASTVSSGTNNTNGILNTTFNVSIPANSTRYMMFILGIAGIDTTVHSAASAYTGVSSFLTSYTALPSEFKTDLSSINTKILNWNIGPFTSTTSIALAANATTANKRNSIQITATVNRPGKVTFYFKSQKIPGCINVVATSTTAICSWKPTIQGQQLISAILAPDDVSYSGSSGSVLINVGKRTGPR